MHPTNAPGTPPGGCHPANMVNTNNNHQAAGVGATNDNFWHAACGVAMCWWHWCWPVPMPALSSRLHLLASEFACPLHCPGGPWGAHKIKLCNLHNTTPCFHKGCHTVGCPMLRPTWPCSLGLATRPPGGWGAGPQPTTGQPTCFLWYVRYVDGIYPV